jgi:hypothetical protein
MAKENIICGSMNNLIVWQTYHDDRQILEYGLHEDEFLRLFKGNDTTIKGKNINYLNAFYSEITTLYWVWKNHVYSNYIGFCHYRRRFSYYLELNDNECEVLEIAHLSSNMLQYYKTWHNYHDYCELIDLVNEKYGKNNPYSENLIYNNVFVPYCSFIMQYEYFEKLCEFMFDLLFLLDKKMGLNMEAINYQNKAKKDFPYGADITYQQRAFSFLAERLISSYIITNMKPICVKGINP